MRNSEAKILYDAQIALMKEVIPGFEVRFKNEHFLQKLIAFFVFPFNPKYMKSFTTTLYPYVYFPNREWLKRVGYTNAFRVLAHEYVHLWDEQEQGHLKYKFRYMFPQALAPLALLAFFAFLWKPALWALVFLLFLGPWPSPGRRDIERRGYLMNMAINYWRYGELRDGYIRTVVRKFTGWAYYKMWPFEKQMTRFVNGDFSTIRVESIFMHPRGRPYFEVHAILKVHGALAA